MASALARENWIHKEVLSREQHLTGKEQQHLISLVCELQLLNQTNNFHWDADQTDKDRKETHWEKNRGRVDNVKRRI